MTTHPERNHHPLRVLHAIFCLGLAVGFGWYGWTHHPLRSVPHRTGAPSGHGTGIERFSQELALRLGLIQLVLPDVVGGLGVLLLLSLGTGVYVRRFEVWLEAHKAGEAAAIRGVGLDQAALGANKDRRKGAAL